MYRRSIGKRAYRSRSSTYVLADLLTGRLNFLYLCEVSSCAVDCDVVGIKIKDFESLVSSFSVFDVLT